MQTDSPKIKVLSGLPSALCAAGERHLFKYLETLAIVKSLFPAEAVEFNSDTVELIANVSNRHSKTIWRRLEKIIDLGWLTPANPTHKVIEGFLLHVPSTNDRIAWNAVSWDYFRERYDIRHKRFYYIKTLKHVQVEYILKSKPLQEQKNRCAAGYRSHLNYDHYRAAEIKQVSGSLQSEAVAEHQLNAYLTRGLYNDDETFALSLHYQKKDEQHLRGDMEINYKTGTKLYRYNSDGGFAKMKRALAKKGVILIQKRKEIIARGMHTTVQSRRTRLGYVQWNEEQRQVELIMPDAIQITPMVHVDSNYETLLKVRQELAKRKKAA